MDKLFGFDFGGRRNNSVWELGSAEKRCLLLVSQALAGPGLWVLHQPLARMDGPRSRAMREFIRLRCEHGDMVVASQEPALELFGSCRELLVLDNGELSVKFHGSGESAADFLADQQGLPRHALKSLSENSINVE